MSIEKVKAQLENSSAYKRLNALFDEGTFTPLDPFAKSGSVLAEVAAGYGIPRGVYVAEVSKGGGAEAAGLEKGDVITEFDGQEITSMDDLQTRLQYYAAGTEVTIKVMRQDGQDGRMIVF